MNRTGILLTAVVLLGAGGGGLTTAPTAAAACNDSSGTVVCAQGDVRGTDAPPPSRPTLGSYGSWCNDSVCFGGSGVGGGGFGVVLGP